MTVEPADGNTPGPALGPEPAAEPGLPALAISACLTGENCTYKAGNHKLDCLDELRKRYRLVLVCPETQGGLPAPRPPAEIRGEKVFLQTGEDASAQFAAGAQAAADIAREAGCKVALLKEKSPSCGFGRIYDGTFSGALVRGDGWGAAALAREGIRIVGDGSVRELLD